MQIKTLREAISQPAILYPAIFCFIWQATPSADTALFYFYNDSLGFGPEFLGRIRLVGSVSALAGVWVFNTFLKKVQLRSIFKWTAITGTVLSFTQVRPSAPHGSMLQIPNVATGSSNRSISFCSCHLACICSKLLCIGEKLSCLCVTTERVK